MTILLAVVPEPGKVAAALWKCMYSPLPDTSSPAITSSYRNTASPKVHADVALDLVQSIMKSCPPREPGFPR